MRFGKLLARAVLALLIAAGMMPWSLVPAGELGRVFSQCMHACNDAYAYCHNGCDSACALSVQDDAEAQNADCRWLCHQACLDHAKICNDACRIIKEGVPLRRTMKQGPAS